MKFDQILEQGYQTISKNTQQTTQDPGNVQQSGQNTQQTAQNTTNNQQNTQQVPSIAEFQKALQTNNVDAVNKMFANADDNIKNAITNLQYDPKQKKFIIIKPVPQGAAQ